MDGKSTYRQKEYLSGQARRTFLDSRTDLFWAALFLSGGGYASNFRLHFHLNEIEVIDI
jgi:hypothetical protein